MALTLVHKRYGDDHLNWSIEFDYETEWGGHIIARVTKEKCKFDFGDPRIDKAAYKNAYNKYRALLQERGMVHIIDEEV